MSSSTIVSINFREGYLVDETLILYRGMYIEVNNETRTITNSGECVGTDAVSNMITPLNVYRQTQHLQE